MQKVSLYPNINSAYLIKPKKAVSFGKLEEIDKKLIEDALKWGLIKYRQGTFQGGVRPTVFSVEEYNIYELLNSIRKLSNAVSVQNAKSISSAVTKIMKFHKSNRSIDSNVIIRDCSIVLNRCKDALNSGPPKKTS